MNLEIKRGLVSNWFKTLQNAFCEDIIRIEKNNHSKCERCWHRNETVGSVKDHPGLCSRCHENVYLNGEKRKLG